MNNLSAASFFKENFKHIHRMSGVKYLQFDDEKLRILLYIADNKPISKDAITELQQIVPPSWKPRAYDRYTPNDITQLTGIEKSNLLKNVIALINCGLLVRQGSKKTRLPGRPGKYLDLASPYTILDLRDELEYRMRQYEREREEFLDIMDREMYAWMKGDEGEESKHFKRYKKAQTELKNRGLCSTSSITNSLREVSWPMVRYWLWIMKQEAEKLPKLELPHYGQMNTTED